MILLWNGTGLGGLASLRASLAIQRQELVAVSQANGV